MPAVTPTSHSARLWLVRWLYAAALFHFLAGFGLSWFGSSALFDTYYREIETAFWGALAPTAGRTQLVWWVAIFGATLQGFALLMGVVVAAADRLRCSRLWGALLVVIVIWAPQDLLISWRGGVWSHLVVDAFALLVLLPPLAWLMRIDRVQP